MTQECVNLHCESVTQIENLPDSQLLANRLISAYLRKIEKKDGAGEEGRTPDLMLGKHTL